MEIIELDGTGWADRLDFWHAMRSALRVIPEHGTGFAAFEDSVFYHPEMLGVRPPFRVIVRHPTDVARSDAEAMAAGWIEQRDWKRRNYGDDVDATLTVEG